MATDKTPDFVPMMCTPNRKNTITSRKNRGKSKSMRYGRKSKWFY